MENKREFHPAAELFPLLRGKAFQDLVADIKKNGLLEPILVDAEGRILDGRNRYRACLEAKVEPRFVDWQGEGSPVDLALSRNLRRRHLGESQRAMVGARLAILEAEARQRKGLRSDLTANLGNNLLANSDARTGGLGAVRSPLGRGSLRLPPPCPLPLRAGFRLQEIRFGDSQELAEGVVHALGFRVAGYVRWW